jgi:repressor LexA
MYSRLEILLKENNMTAYRLAKDTQINTATFSEWKKGTYTPKADKLQKIADYFNVSLDWLLGNTDIRTVISKHNDEAPIQSPEVIQLIKSVEKLTPEQIKYLTNFIDSMTEK